MLRLPVVLILVVLALAGLLSAEWVWRADRHAALTGAAPDVVLSGARLPVDDVTVIRLERRNEPALEFRRDGASWRQVEPFAHPMDPFSIGQLVRAAADLAVIDRVDPRAFTDGTLTLDTLMLDPPAATIRYTWADGAVDVRLGRLGVAGRAYLQVDDSDDVLIVPQVLHERALEMDPKEWRSRALFDDVGVNSDVIDIEAGPTHLRLERDRRTWRMTAPVRTRVDAAARDRLFDALGAARASGFLVDQPDALAPFSLDPPAATVTVETTRRVADDAGVVTETPDVQRLRIGGVIRSGSIERYGLVEGRDTVIRLGEGLLRALLREPTLFVDPTASGILPADVKRIDIHAGTERFSFERALDRWTAPDRAGTVDGAAVAELLEQLTTLRAASVELGRIPIGAELASVTFIGFSERPLGTVRITRENADAPWVMDDGDGIRRLFPARMRVRLAPADYGLTPTP
ncbi:MAG: DUF4340 domain-containing protein [Phycisphaerales bacterium]|nr:DUF4340 domain-containing protein [Phycisphaerales bacterium]